MSILIKYCEGRMFCLWVGDDFLIFLKASHFVIRQITITTKLVLLRQLHQLNLIFFYSGTPSVSVSVQIFTERNFIHFGDSLHT